MPRLSSAASKALCCAWFAVAASVAAQPSAQFEPIRPSGFNAEGELVDDGKPAPKVTEETVILNQGGYDPNAFYVKPAVPGSAPKKIDNHHIAPPPVTATSTRAQSIYRCKDNRGMDIYVDDDSRHKFRHCLKIRDENAAPVEKPTLPVDPQMHESPLPTCSGALLYKGSTYVFSDQEPCPIPEEVFEFRKPLEANPSYYAPPAQP